MRAARLVQALVAGTLLVVATSPPAEAQRGLGKGRGRQPAPAPTEQPTPKDQPAGKDQAQPKEELGAELALPWSEREARMIGQREKDATVLVRADATESQVKKLLPTAGVVHLATHGELSEDDPLSSAMLLVPGGGEDGRLEVREVFGLDMHARLVVLSACETGLGKLSRGDELVGLQRAFLYAGTPAVVTTLWKVDDKATFELVRSFYTRLEGTGPVEALRQAQVETMRAFPHPDAWAAFGLSGLPR